MSKLYYIRDVSRGYAGNCLIWWKHNNQGYSCDIGQARQFTEDELNEYLQAGDLEAFPVEYIDMITVGHVDMQAVDRRVGLRQPPSENRSDDE